MGVVDTPASQAANRAGAFPRLRYMGSKYRLVPHLAAVFTELAGRTALDAFSGSGVVSYLFKALGYRVTANDFLTFPSVIAQATVVNQDTTLAPGDVERICGPAADYAPPRDDNCYIKRYHFLEGLSVYWRGQQVMENTQTRKLAKRYTPFSYTRTATNALRRTFRQFSESAIVLSYSSNAVPDAAAIEALLREVKDDVDVRLVDHTYTFGTHASVHRRAASEYLFIAR